MQTRNLYLIILSLITILFSSMATSDNTKEQTTVLITGANRGIGLALANQFQNRGYHVIATARAPQKANELRTLGVQIMQLDITNQQSIDKLTQQLNKQPIDILINNAGVAGHSSRRFEDLKIDRLKRVFDINSLGALRVTQALLPNLLKGTAKTVASISSRMGSIENNNQGGGLAYRASKTALNSFNKSLSIEFSDRGFTFVVLHPGWVRTDMTNENATYSPTESAQNLFKVISQLTTKDNGRFYDLHGKPIAW